MRGYASPRRMNDWPVLMVVWDREAEDRFQQVGEQAGVPMLTSTVERIKETQSGRRSTLLVHVWGGLGPGLTGPGLRAAPGDPGLSQKAAPAPGVLVGSATGGKGAFPLG